jgi:hypothetical protein
MSWEPPWGINQGAKAGERALKVRLRTADSSNFQFCSIQKERFSNRKRNLAHYTAARSASQKKALQQFQSNRREPAWLPGFLLFRVSREQILVRALEGKAIVISAVQTLCIRLPPVPVVAAPGVAFFRRLGRSLMSEAFGCVTAAEASFTEALRLAFMLERMKPARAFVACKVAVRLFIPVHESA